MRGRAQHGAGARFGAFLTQHNADDRLQSLGERGRYAMESLGEAFRSPASYALLAVFIIVIIGSRELFSQGVPAIGTIVE